MDGSNIELWLVGFFYARIAAVVILASPIYMQERMLPSSELFLLVSRNIPANVTNIISLIQLVY